MLRCVRMHTATKGCRHTQPQFRLQRARSREAHLNIAVEVGPNGSPGEALQHSSIIGGHVSAAVVLQQSQWHEEASDHINDTQALMSILLTLMSVQPQQCPTVGSGALSSHCCAGCMLEQPCRTGEAVKK